MTKKIVMVLDSDPVFSESVACLLLPHGYEVLAAQSGEEGIALFCYGARPVAILLDPARPIMNGWRFLDWLRRSRAIGPIPRLVLYTVGRASQATRRLFPSAAFLPKSAAAVALSRGLDELLGPKTPDRNSSPRHQAGRGSD